MPDPDDRKRRSRGISDDMSPEAIARRLELASQLYEAWLQFRGARRLGPVTPAEQVAEPPPRSGLGAPRPPAPD
jgi:hypothetical protein